MGCSPSTGCKLKPLVIAGPGSTNAVISGSADFALASTAVQTRAAARGQRLLSIANPTDRPIVQIILRKDLVPNFDPKAPLADRIRLLRGRTTRGRRHRLDHARLSAHAGQARGL